MTSDLNTKRIQWLSTRVTYLEHIEQDGTSSKIGGYWPQSADDPYPEEEFAGAHFLAYIDAQIKKDEMS